MQEGTGGRRRRRATPLLLGALALLLGSSTVACGEERNSGDELYDFVEPDASERRGSTPYDTYVLLVERQGVAFLPFQEAELRAQDLCTAPEAAATSGDDMVSDTALVRAYCPEMAE